MEEIKNKLEEYFKSDDIKLNEPMSQHTTFRTGGNASFFVSLNKENIDKIEEALKYLKENNIPYVFIGNGSNVLFPDDGYNGVVFSLRSLCDYEIFEDHVYASSGIMLSALSRIYEENSIAGLEFACGIPGTLGGGIFMNAGAYGGEMRDIVQSVKYMDSIGNIYELESSELDFSYRHSFFEDKNHFILSATIKLHKSDQHSIRSLMNDLLKKRKTKQPLEFPSAGSTFKRPKEGYAAALIEQCGLKGKTIGGAQISEKHSGFIVNIGNATCKDVSDLILETQKVVKQQTGVWLEPEIKFIGDF